jgi:hypothetical protein
VLGSAFHLLIFKEIGLNPVRFGTGLSSKNRSVWKALMQITSSRVPMAVEVAVTDACPPLPGGIDSFFLSLKSELSAMSIDLPEIFAIRSAHPVISMAFRFSRQSQPSREESEWGMCVAA